MTHRSGFAAQTCLLACRVFWTVLAALCNELVSLCKGRWTDLFTKTTLVQVPAPPLASSVCLSLCQTFMPPSTFPMLPSPTKHANKKTPYTSRYPITHCLLFPVLHPPPLVLSRRLSLLCGLIPTRTPFYIVTT